MKNKDEKIFRSPGIEIKLKEGNVVEQIPTRVQLLRTGTFYDPRYGKVEIKKEHFDNMVLKFDEGIRGIKLMIDYKHDSDAEAAGWIQGLEVIETQLSEGDPEQGIEPTTGFELWADVDWTPNGSKKLSDKEFAYLSADFDTDYRDNENPEVSHGHVLKGAALTNRPVIKKMSPAIQLSETDSNINNKETEMSEKKLAELESENKTMGDSLAKVDAFMKDMGVSSIEDLMKMISEMRSQNETMLSEKLEIEKKSKLDELMKDGKINAAQHESAMKLSEESFNAYVEIAKAGEKVVKLSETGSNETPSEDDNNEDVEEKVIELAEKKMKEDSSLSFAEATAEVLSEDKKLKDEYSKIHE